MTSQPFLIANMRVGVERDLSPWLLPEDAFPNLEDCYLYRGRIQRRRGFEQLGRLVTSTLGVDSLNLLPVMGLRTRELTTTNQEQLIAFDTEKANFYSNFLETFVDITFNQPANAAPFSWTGSDSDFFWTENYLDAFWATNGTPGFQNTVNATVLGQGDGIRFYDGTQWFNFLPPINSTEFLMGAVLIVSYRNRLVMLNTFEGTAFGLETNFRQRARWSQNGTPYYSAAAVPAGFTGGSDAQAWRDDVTGKGGFIDAPTQESIISAQFFKDTLIVFFERSTWQLRYTGNELLPFIWERINVELGVESTFSMVPFDSGIVGVGNYGIMTCDSTGVKRIDQVIPDEVFNIHNGNDGVKRVYGIRDYTQQLIYWTFPSADSNPTFPNRILIYNYLDGSYSFFNDSFTCFGTFQPADDTRWEDLVQEWQETPTAWNNGQYQSDYPLIVAGNQQGFVFKNINRGEIINDFSLYISTISNAVQAVVTSPDHNLSTGTIIVLDEIVGMTLAVVAEAEGTALTGTTSFSGALQNPPIFPTSVTIALGATNYTDDGEGNLDDGSGNTGTINYTTGEFAISFAALGADTAVTGTYTKSLNNNIFRVSDETQNTFKIQILDTNNNYVYVDSSDLSAYVSDGFIKVRNNFLIETKRFNPFIKEGDQTRLQNVDFFIETANELSFTCYVYLDENNNSFVEQDVLKPVSSFSQKIWLRTYFSIIGQFALLQLTFDDEQMFDLVFPEADVTIHGMMLWMSRAGRLTYGSTF